MADGESRHQIVVHALSDGNMSMRDSGDAKGKGLDIK